MLAPSYLGSPAPSVPSLSLGTAFGAPHERTDYFEANPRQAFNLFQPDFGVGAKRRSLMDSLPQIFSMYEGHLARNIAGGGRPEFGFFDYLAGTRGQQPFDFNQYFYESNPGAIAREEGSVRPTTRFFF